MGLVAVAAWYFVPRHDVGFFFLFGGIAWLLKAIFLMRKTSDGFSQEAPLSLSQVQPRPKPPKVFPSPAALVAQVVQDFGAGSVLGSVVLSKLDSVTNSGAEPAYGGSKLFNAVPYTHHFPVTRVAVAGAIFFVTGWLIRHFSAPRPAPLLKAIQQDIASRRDQIDP